MNCRNFIEITGDLARGAIVDARKHAEALSHAEECAPCAARLADERSLCDGLRALAANDATLSASPRVEAELLAAFRARASATGSHALSNAHEPQRDAAEEAPVNVLPFARPQSSRRLAWGKGFIAAASAAAAAIVLFMLIPPGTQGPTANRVAEVASERRADQSANERRASASGISMSNPSSSASRSIADRDDETESTENALVASETGKASTGEEPSPRDISSTARYERASATRRNAPRSPSPVRAARAERASREAARDDEIATGFIPLVQEARLAEMDGGHMVRVELPRSALVRFGLPMNVERASERVTADVLLGEDGIARAIRFVR